MKIVFMVESVTMAHPTRSFELATSLIQAGHEVVFAATESPIFLKSQNHGMTWVDLKEGVTSKVFLKALENASLPYTVKGLDQAMREDLQVIHQYQPDLIVGDMRLSLQVSARLSKVKWINLSNLVWNPESDLGYLMPEMQATRIFGSSIQHLIPRMVLEKNH
jgi:UDP:flavonoid glycosyltransferase YjiC (YdhE family)